jgi:hypothetical protein
LQLTARAGKAFAEFVFQFNLVIPRDNILKKNRGTMRWDENVKQTEGAKKHATWACDPAQKEAMTALPKKHAMHEKR